MNSLINQSKSIAKSVLAKISPRFKLNHKNRGIINYIDVGSVGGLPKPWDRNANLIKFCLNFEPNEAPPKRTQNVLTYNAAVWEKEETREFYIYQGFNGTGSSLFEQNFEYVEANRETLFKRGPAYLAETWHERAQLVKQTQLKCRTLNDIVAEELPDTPFHFMKIDAQGAEYNILKGGDALLESSCVGLHLELFTLPIYKGIVLLDEVESYLGQFGFEKAKQFPAHGTFDSQHDCLFLKQNGDSKIVNAIKKVYQLV